jgi:hypothetical protein
MKKLLLVSYLVALVFFIWGYAMVRYEAFPWQYFFPVEQEIIAYIQGGSAEKTSLREKVVNDLDVIPTRLLYEYSASADRDYVRMDVEGLKSRRERPYLFSSDAQMKGYRFIFAAFDFEDSMQAAILLDSSNNIVHRWIVDQNAMAAFFRQQNMLDNGNRKMKSQSSRLPQGFEILPDGTLILAEGYNGNGMHSIDFCGNFNWSILGKYHHVVALDEYNDTIWGFGPGDIEEIDYKKGEVIRAISIKDIQKANLGNSIFTSRRNISSGSWLPDPIHKNDIEPLTPRFADAFPMFDAGDLLMTHRSTSMVFVVDQETLEIKWWRTGFTRRPHDADWNADGTITVYDNNMREPVEGNDGYLDDLGSTRYSRIMQIDPATFETNVLYDGSKDNFYSGARGVHQLLPNGNTLITSSYQGRVLEVSPSSETVFEFVNTYDEKDSLSVSAARWFPEDYFSFDVTDQSLCK